MGARQREAEGRGGVKTLAALLVAAGAWAQSAEEADAIVGKVVRERYGEIRRCYDKALARDGKMAGSVGLMLSVEAGGKVSSARVDGDSLGEPRTAACLRALLATFAFPGFAEAADVALPLAFTPPERPFVVRHEDAPAYPILGGMGEARVLLDAKTVGAKEAALSRLTMKPGAKVPLHVHPTSAEIIYVLSGKGRMRGPKGVWRDVTGGTAIVIPAGSAHAFEATGDAPVEAVQIYSPPGPEQRFRDPKNVTGTMPVKDGEAVPDGAEPDYGPLDRLAVPAGASPGARFFYLVAGSATLEVAREAIDLREGAAAYLPARDARLVAAQDARIVRWPAP